MTQKAFIRLLIIVFTAFGLAVLCEECKAQKQVTPKDISFKSAETGQFIKKEVADKSPATSYRLTPKKVKLCYTADREAYLKETHVLFQTKPGFIILKDRWTNDELFVLACEYQVWRLKKRKGRE